MGLVGLKKNKLVSFRVFWDGDHEFKAYFCPSLCPYYTCQKMNSVMGHYGIGQSLSPKYDHLNIKSSFLLKNFNN